MEGHWGEWIDLFHNLSLPHPETLHKISPSLGANCSAASRLNTGSAIRYVDITGVPTAVRLPSAPHQALSRRWAAALILSGMRQFGRNPDLGF